MPFSLANSETVLPPSAPAPLPNSVPTQIWEGEITTQDNENSVSVFVRYEAIAPDTAVVAPFNFEILALLEQQQADDSWEEIGRQNQPIRKLEQGAVRQIIVSPANVGIEEGVDNIIAGFGGVVEKRKSAFADEATNNLRVRLVVVDYDSAGPNPFESVTVSVNVNRYSV